MFTKDKKYCKCGCKTEIIIRPHYKWKGIPDYIRGHHFNGKKFSKTHRNNISIGAIERHKKYSHPKGMLWKKHTIETKEKLKKLSEGRKHSEKTKKSISNSNKGNIPWNSGKTDVYSKKTLKKMSDAAKGEKNPMYDVSINIGDNNTSKRFDIKKKISAGHQKISLSKWEGFVTNKNILIRSSEKHKKWRNYIFERDDWTCQECGQIGHRLQAHHIKRFFEYPELRFEVENGITLCKICHEKIKFKETWFIEYFENKLKATSGVLC